LESQEGYKIGSGRDLFAFFDRIIRKQGAEVMLSTPVKRLIQNPQTKEVLGVIAENQGEGIAIKAKKAVILTCGGFEGNREMLTTYIGELPAPIHVSGTPYNTGDGIKMVLDVGADLWHMSGIEWGRQGLKVPDHPAAFWISPMGWSWINVNKYGKRFRNEGESYGHAKRYLEIFQFDTDRIEWPNYPWYMIFDERARKAGPIINREKELDRSPFITYNISSGLYMPSPDNSKEIEKGWIKQANTIAELATQAGIDKAGLQGTVARYNKYCKSKKGSDPDFHRNPETLESIDTPPYYAIECTINIINTQGGPRRNAKGQVMSPYDTPIPRLYAGGEFGSIWGFLYPGACNLPECIISGMIAGRNAIAEAPWE
jgi:succinate dehydrogenase/fumarate reductase flavoprotein subunit